MTERKVRKYAPIGPIAILEDLDRYNELGDYHVLLAHDVMNNLQRYRALFARYHDCFLILDNSVIELGMPLTNGLIDLAEALHVDCIVLPDVLRDQKATEDLIHIFVDGVGAEEMKKYDWMLIPQGLIYDGIISCAERMMDYYGEFIKYMGIPRWIANELGSRNEVTRWVSSHMTEFGLKGIHMMGMSQNFADDLKCTTYFPGVMGIDSANPLVLGQMMRVIDDQANFEHMDRGNYWQQHSITGTTLYNIRRVRQMLNKI